MKTRVYYEPTPNNRYEKGEIYQRTGTFVLCTEDGYFLTGTCIADKSGDAVVGDHGCWTNFRKAHGIMIQHEQD